MSNQKSEDQNSASDRGDVVRQGSSLSGSNKRDNDSTEKALHPKQTQDDHTGMTGSGVIARDSDTAEVVNQDPGETQKQNQSDKKDDPLAA